MEPLVEIRVDDQSLFVDGSARALDTGVLFGGADAETEHANPECLGRAQMCELRRDHAYQASVAVYDMIGNELELDAGSFELRDKEHKSCGSMQGYNLSGAGGWASAAVGASLWGMTMSALRLRGR